MSSDKISEEMFDIKRRSKGTDGESYIP